MYTYESVFLSFSPTDMAKYSWGVYFDVAVGALAMIADGALAELNLNQMSEVRERVMEGDREKSERDSVFPSNYADCQRDDLTRLIFITVQTII